MNNTQIEYINKVTIWLLYRTVINGDGFVGRLPNYHGDIGNTKAIDIVDQGSYWRKHVQKAFFLNDRESSMVWRKWRDTLCGYE